MAEAGTLHDAFIDELRDAYDAEKQLTKALPKMAKAASSPELRAAFEAHLEETRGQVERLEEVFGTLDEKVRGKHCDGIEGIIEEGKSVMEEDFDETTMDACLIAAASACRALRDGGLRHAGGVGARDGAHGSRRPPAGDARRREGRRREAVDAGRGGINQEAADAAHPEQTDRTETPRRRKHRSRLRRSPRAADNAREPGRSRSGRLRQAPTAPCGWPPRSGLSGSRRTTS